jgi:hypothetical protein
MLDDIGNASRCWAHGIGVIVVVFVVAAGGCQWLGTDLLRASWPPGWTESRGTMDSGRSADRWRAGGLPGDSE